MSNSKQLKIAHAKDARATHLWEVGEEAGHCCPSFQKHFQYWVLEVGWYKVLHWWGEIMCQMGDNLWWKEGKWRRFQVKVVFKSLCMMKFPSDGELRHLCFPESVLLCLVWGKILTLDCWPKVSFFYSVGLLVQGFCKGSHPNLIMIKQKLVFNHFPQVNASLKIQSAIIYNFKEKGRAQWPKMKKLKGRSYFIALVFPCNVRPRCNRSSTMQINYWSTIGKFYFLKELNLHFVKLFSKLSLSR